MNIFIKFIGKIKEKILAFYRELIDEIKGIENKRKFALMVSLWFAIFFIVVIIANVKNNMVKTVNADIKSDKVDRLDDGSETALLSDILCQLMKADLSVANKTMRLQDVSWDGVEEKKKHSESIVTDTTDKPEEVVENKVIPIKNINVVKEQLKDDAIVVNTKPEIIYSEPGSVKSSLDIDKTRIINCIDVSKHQGKIDWKAVKESGIEYAFIRVAYRGYETGALAIDSRFEENLKGARANGIETGVYIFSQAVNEKEALEEASVILNYIKNYKITLPVVIDWETAPGYRTYSGISKSKLTDIISVFCDTVEKNGYEPMVYMCQTDFSGRVDGKKLASKYKIWMAWYFGNYAKSNRQQNIFKYGDKIPDVKYRYDVWQYSKNGYVNGISTPVDMNIYILPEKKPDPVLTLEKDIFITNIMQDKMNQGTQNNQMSETVGYNKLDLKKGVKLTDSDGNDLSGKVEYIIKNTDGKTVAFSEALKTSGKYSVCYICKEYPLITKTAALYVRDLPEIYFDGELCGKEQDKTIEYVYNDELVFEENIEIIHKNLLNSINSKCYDTIKSEGKALEVINEVVNGLENIDETIIYGDYIINYVADDNGLKNSINIKLSIKENNDLPEETEDMTENETKETIENQTEENET